MTPIHTAEAVLMIGSGIPMICAVSVAFIAVMGYLHNRTSAKRKEDQASADARAGQIMDAVAKSHDDNAKDVRELHTRMTRQETKSEHQNHAIAKLEALLREKIDETKDLIKGQGETSTKQFEELARSFREARETKFKP